MYKQKNMEKKLETGLPAKNVHWVGALSVTCTLTYKSSGLWIFALKYLGDFQL